LRRFFLRKQYFDDPIAKGVMGEEKECFLRKKILKTSKEVSWIGSLG